ncbi:hypothetical protein RR46_10159 [Papilio xuthus]|uniref:Uncharacterized protein n=1 Tax=Papilio xuthus TaxID=66420 RepID=A0A194PZU3_PAPXU|nr:hypothetical protein RR46_10159 [Papilio xuthus]
MRLPLEAHYIAAGLARDPILNLPRNSSELSDETGAPCDRSLILRVISPDREPPSVRDDTTLVAALPASKIHKNSNKTVRYGKYKILSQPILDPVKTSKNS